LDHSRSAHAGGVSARGPHRTLSCHTPPPRDDRIPCRRGGTIVHRPHLPAVRLPGTKQQRVRGGRARRAARRSSPRGCVSVPACEESREPHPLEEWSNVIEGARSPRSRNPADHSDHGSFHAPPSPARRADPDHRAAVGARDGETDGSAQAMAASGGTQAAAELDALDEAIDGAVDRSQARADGRSPTVASEHDGRRSPRPWTRSSWAWVSMPSTTAGRRA
jgi:hypothetical protein